MDDFPIPSDPASSRMFVPAYPFCENTSKAAIKIFSFVPFAIKTPPKKRPIGRVSICRFIFFKKHLNSRFYLGKK